MAAVSHPDPAATARQGVAAHRARRAALFVSGLQRSDAPTVAMAAEAITATMLRFGIPGCVSRMAQEFGDHPDAAAERMSWICRLIADMPAWPPMPATAGRAVGGAGNMAETNGGYYRAATGPRTRPERHHAARPVRAARLGKDAA